MTTSYASAVHPPTPALRVSLRVERTEAELVLAHQDSVDARLERIRRTDERRENAIARFVAAMGRGKEAKDFDAIRSDIGDMLIQMVATCDARTGDARAAQMDAMRQILADCLIARGIAAEGAPPELPEPLWVAKADEAYHAAQSDAAAEDRERWDFSQQ